MSNDRPRLKLQPGGDKRAMLGHPWIFSNELVMDAAAKALPPGEIVTVIRPDGRPLGAAFFNPHSLIAARLLTRDADRAIDEAFLHKRLQRALKLRDRLIGAPFYRLVHAEADGFPGCTIDRFGDVVVVEPNSAGADRLIEPLVAALDRLLKPRTIVISGDGPARTLEGLAPIHHIAKGSLDGAVELQEHGARFLADLAEGQKTGWFYDQRSNRDALARYVEGRAVLDVFSYIGGWSLRALKLGASSAVAVDSSAPALEGVAKNAELNGVTVEAIQGKAIDVLREMRTAQRKFDVVVVDPPALIKRKKDLEAGSAHYGALNKTAIELLAPDGILISCSCSHHLDAESLQRILLRESRAAGRRLQILEQGGQGPDHPVHPAIPETRYLKAFFCRVV